MNREPAGRDSTSASPLPANLPAACVSAAALRALLRGELAPDEETAVTQHLEACAACERVALQLSDDAPTRALLAEHRRVAPDGASATAELDEIRERLHVLGWFRGNETAEGNGSTQAAVDDGTQANGAAGTGRREPPPAPTVGKFEIIELIGGGGFGMVYLAKDRVLNRLVALKLARASVLADPDLKGRFVREAEALARLEHPGIVPVYEAGEHDGTCYLAVGYCDGPTLEKWLRDQAEEIDPKLAARIALALSEAVEHAHQQGILHRDIKPSNVLLDKATSAGESPSNLPFTPKLTDFGLAKIAEQQSDSTISGVVLGTLQYMATEQAAGLVDRIGPPTDVYALGAVLYEMLTGRPPIRGATAIDTLRRVLVEEPPHPRHLAKGVPDDLDAIVMRCLDKSPTRRYPSAGELAADLKRFLEGRPTVARPLSLSQRATRWIGRNQAVTAVLTLVMLVMVLGVGLLAYDQRLKSEKVAYDQRLKEEQVANRQQRAEAAYRDDVYSAAQRYRAGDVAQTVELLKRQLPAAGSDDLRGFEWHYLWALTTHDTFAEASPGQDVYQLCLSPKGDQLAASCKNDKLYFYDSHTLAKQASINTKHGEVNGAAYAPDNKHIATVGDDGFVRVWDAKRRRLVREWRAHDAKAYNAVFYDEGRKLATCGEEPVIRLWDFATGKSDGVLEGHTAPVEAIVLSPVEALLASASADKAAIVWDLTTKTLKTRLTGHTDKLTCLAFSPDGEWLATGGQDCSVCLWRHARERRRSRGFHLDAVQTVGFTGDGRLVAGDRGGTIRTYWLGPNFPEVAKEDSLEKAEDHWLAHSDRIWSLAMLSAPGQFVSSGRDGQLRAWQRGQDLVHRWKPKQDDRYGADFSRDGTRLFAVCAKGGVEAFDPATAEPLPPPFSVPGTVWESLAVLHGREQVAAASNKGDVVVWNWRTKNFLHSWKFGDHAIERLHFSPAANLLAAIAYAREDVLLIDSNSGEKVAELSAPSCTDCAISPDGQRLAVDTLNQLAIFDLQTHQRVRLVPAHSLNINAIAYSPDGQLIATGSGDRTVKLWTADGESVAELTGHATDVFALAFTPDGRSLVTGGGDGRLKIFHIATRRELLDVHTGFKQIRRIAVAPNNRQLAVIGDDWEMALISVPERGEEN